MRLLLFLFGSNFSHLLGNSLNLGAAERSGDTTENIHRTFQLDKATVVLDNSYS